MTVVAEDERMAELRRLGASAPLMRLAAGECIHDVFRDNCLGPPYYVYHGAGVPDGPPFVPLWDHHSRVVGLRACPGGAEFIEFSIEAPQEIRTTARTEQGFWTTRFDFLYECDAPDEILRQAADLVEFRFLDRFMAAREAAEEQLRTFRDHQLWLRDLVARIDEEAAQAMG